MFRYAGVLLCVLLLSRVSAIDSWSSSVVHKASDERDTTNVLALLLTSGISVTVNSGLFENSVSVHFSPDIFKLLVDQKCNYRLRDFETEWHEVTESTIVYPAVASGRYTFEIKPTGSLHGIEYSLGLKVSSALWSKWILVLSMVLTAGALLYVVLRTRVMDRRKAEQSRLELQQKLADMEMKALRAQMSPHFIFNSLNSINRYIVKSDPETASVYLTKFARLIRLILENSNHKVISLEQELSALKLYIELEALRFSKKFTHTLTVDPNFDPAAVGIPPMVIQPFIENAIWHGLLHKETPGQLTISISLANETLRCVITDNGVGRRKAAELKSKSISHSKSFGMKITIDRLNMVRENAPVSTLEIVDLSDEFGNAAGTKVILDIGIVPINTEY